MEFQQVKSKQKEFQLVKSLPWLMKSYHQLFFFSSLLVMCIPTSAPTSIGNLPESVVDYVLVHLDPHEICRLAALNRAFRGASLVDFV
ncbi:hypothetical protein L1987_32501 [Smallanthus sonchifolius]|uniref:Uncharacterized protein n=1 Tax=Smallanthus sonchifolius TaxID=185202 RepID=A0ACB9HPR3_9ASTR|nr:hypothetical protein L1987_32501 [Smallanthus sonchifolius]